MKMAHDSDQQTREQAARKVMQQILADQYKTEIEKRKALRDLENGRAKEEDRIVVETLIHNTDPNMAQDQLRQTQGGSTASQMRWRQKYPGDLNFDMKTAEMSRQSQPNIIRDAFLRDQQRKQEVARYYGDIRADMEKAKQEKKSKKEEELDWEKRYISNEANIFQTNYEREVAKKDEQKRQYAEELKRQFQLNEERKREAHRMTQTEKRLNYDNLQVGSLYAGVQVVGPEQLRLDSGLGRQRKVLQTTDCSQRQR